jgi:hypothetical protein
MKAKAKFHPEDLSKPAIGKNLLWLDYYDSWMTDVDMGFHDGLHAFVYYGGYAALGERKPKLFRDGGEPWKADAIRDLRVHDGGTCFGLQIQLPHQDVKFEPGRTYLVELPFAKAPDLITINDRVAWRRDDVVVEKDAEIARFAWRADAAKAVFRFLVTYPAGEIRFVSPGKAAPSIRENPNVAPAEPGERFVLPAGVQCFEMKPFFRQWLAWNTRPAKWPSSVPKVAWETDPVGIVIDINGIGQYSFADQLQNIQHLLRCHRFGAVGIDGMFHWAWGGWPPQYAGYWPYEVVPGDLSPADMDRFVERNGIRHVILNWCQFGEWFQTAPHDFPDPIRPYRPNKFFQAVINGNIIQTRYPDVQVYLWVPEFRLPGALVDPRNRIEDKASERQEWPDGNAPFWASIWHKDGSLQTRDLWAKWDKLLDGNRDWQEKTRQCMEAPDRTHFAIQVESPFVAPAAVRGGADVIDTKSIHRQNVQAFIAGGRGCARAAGLKFQLEIDNYHGNAYNTLGPLEMEQIYRLFYASGADMIYSQADLFALTPDKKVVPNEVGAGALRAIRWLRQHPRRGEQQVPFCVLQGDAARLNFGPNSLQTRDGHGQSDPRRPEQADFEAITAFVPKMGHWWRSDYRQMFTGMPCGPFDIAPAEHALESLDRYRLAVMAGWHGMTAGQYERIAPFVAADGIFVCALGHLRKRGEGDWERNGRPLVADLAPIFGVRMAPDGTPELAGAKVLTIDETGQPLVTRRGNAILVWREQLQALDTEIENRSIIQMLTRLVEEKRVVRFEPADDFLEAVFSRRDGLIFVHLFNHARIKQPCGIGPDGKPWRGTVWIDRQWALPGIAAPSAVRLTETMHAVPSRIQLEEDRIGLAVTLDRHAEFVLGESSTLAQCLFPKNLTLINEGNEGKHNHEY